ncbi:MAG TPA: deaminase [Candidatus Saccharimonadales bacterium]
MLFAPPLETQGLVDILGAAPGGLLNEQELVQAAGGVSFDALPRVPILGTQYYPDKRIEPASPDLEPLEEQLLVACLSMGELALLNGNPPIGAVLLNRETGAFWGALTVDKTRRTIFGHAEVRAYFLAEDTVGDQLENCTLITTAQPCSSCTPPYAEGKIGRIVYAAPRDKVREVCDLMRERDFNLPQAVADGKTTTTVIEGHHAPEALAAFAVWGQLHKAGRVNV